MMLKEAMEYIANTSKPVKIEENGHVYTDKCMHEISYTFPEIEMCTLSSLVSYLKENPDFIEDPIILHVQSPTKVAAYTSTDEQGDRRYLAVCKPMLPSFPFDCFKEKEHFLIGLQSKFVPDPETDLELLFRFAGTVEAGTVAEYGDDGISQKATVKTGIAGKKDAVIPNPVQLKPYRTFVEVPQPCSKFVFRMKQDRDGAVNCGLFEADGGAWRNEAMESIKEYLQAALEGVEGVLVIA